MESQQVKIGREFFAKIKNDYADWEWALIREFLQNSFDAPGCDEVTITVEDVGDTTELLVWNNGDAMTHDILFNKLLTLGGSGKNFEGENTGGFGVAKSLLYYTHLSYKIQTGKFVVEGSGASYTVQEQKPILGTSSKVVIEGNHASILVNEAEKFAKMSQWKGKLTVNGETLNTDLKKGARRKDLGWGVVYTNNSFSNTCIVRVNGQPMFTRFTRYKGCVLIELTGKALNTLTSNRDSLRSNFNSELSDLLTALAVDKRSALREQKAAYKRYIGEKIKSEASKPKAAAQNLDDMIDVAALMTEVFNGPTTESAPGTSKAGIATTVESRVNVNVSIGNEFILKNTTGMVTPSYFEPGEKFSRYSKELIKAWAACLLKIYQIHGISGEFSVGFVLDDESEAEFERSGAYGDVYYLNPARVVCQKSQPTCRSFKARFVGAWTNRFQIVSLAAHEFVHGAFNLSEHDEDYAGKLTDVMALVLENFKDFAPLFRS